MNKWRAVYGFSFEMLDEPVTLGPITLCPAPPEYRSGCVHYFDFETSSGDSAAQARVLDIAQARLNDLTELAALAPRSPKVTLLTVSLIECSEKLTPQQITVNFEFELAPLLSAAAGRHCLLSVKPLFDQYVALSDEHRAAVGRSLRWQYRGREAASIPEDRFIYLWISFNCLYGLYEEVQGHSGSEVERVSAFEEYFRDSVTHASSSLSWIVGVLGRSGLTNRRGDDVAAPLLAAHREHSEELTGLLLRCLYALRCQLFHGGHSYSSIEGQEILQAGSNYLSEFLQAVTPLAIKDLASGRP